MIEILKMILMGIIQGTSEFLPISSSGHLAVLERVLGFEEPGLFIAQMLHFGTFLSVLFVFRKDVLNLIKEFINLIINIVKRDNTKINGEQKTALYIILASIPTAIIGIVFKDTFESFYSNMRFISVMFLITAVLLYFTDYFLGNKNIYDVNIFVPIGIGMVQGLAILPGISRSGSTIFAATSIDIKKSEAAKFSFLLSLPATFGAFIFGIRDMIKVGESASFSLPLLIGVIVSFVVGVISLKFLLNLINKNKLKYFSVYLLVIAIITFFIK